MALTDLLISRPWFSSGFNSRRVSSSGGVGGGVALLSVVVVKSLLLKADGAE